MTAAVIRTALEAVFLAIGSERRGRDEAGIGHEHQHRVSRPACPAFGFVSAFPEVPYTGHGVYAEENADSRRDRLVRGPRGAARRTVIELVAEDIFGHEQGDGRVAGYFVNREPLVVPVAVLDGVPALRRVGRRAHRLASRHVATQLQS